MCNWSEAILERGIEEGIQKGIQKGMQEGIEKGIEKGMERGLEEGLQRGRQKERLNAIERMIQANLTKEQIISCGYTEEEFVKVEGLLCANV